jgi:hypothetical protein
VKRAQALAADKERREEEMARSGQTVNPNLKVNGPIGQCCAALWHMIINTNWFYLISVATRLNWREKPIVFS